MMEGRARSLRVRQNVLISNDVATTVNAKAQLRTDQPVTHRIRDGAIHNDGTDGLEMVN